MTPRTQGLAGKGGTIVPRIAGQQFGSPRTPHQLHRGQDRAVPLSGKNGGSVQYLLSVKAKPVQEDGLASPHHQEDVTPRDSQEQGEQEERERQGHLGGSGHGQEVTGHQGGHPPPPPISLGNHHILTEKHPIVQGKSSKSHPRSLTNW